MGWAERVVNEHKWFWSCVPYAHSYILVKFSFPLLLMAVANIQISYLSSSQDVSARKSINILARELFGQNTWHLSIDVTHSIYF